MNKEKTPWTDEQLAAINHRGGGAIISAAAGSGKTAVLVERACRMILDEERKIPADRLVIATFTKKAAEEIKSRLSARLSRESHTGEWVQQQLILLEDAQITTISAFCLNLLRGFEDRFSLTPGFRILDETESDEYLNRALDFAMKKLYDGEFDDEELRLVHKSVENSDSFGLRGVLRSLHNAAMQAPYPDEWLRKIAGEFPPAKELFAYAQSQVRSAAEKALNSAYELDGLLTNAKLAADIDVLEELAQIEIIPECSENLPISVSGNVSRFLAVKVPSFRCPPKSGGEIKFLREEIKEQTDIILKVLKLVESFKKASDIQRPVKVPLIRLYNIFSSEFTRLKTTANALDFNDVEHYCLKLFQLEEEPEGLREKYDEIIVDEFQDSNFVQYEIFRLLSRNEENLFFVGDIKQSIYRFRSADPSVFTALINNPNYKKLFLNRNFRSSDQVIDSINDVFTAAMTVESGGVKYDESQRLYPKDNNINYGDDGKTTLYVLSRDEKRALDIPTEEFEARFIASYILKTIEDGFQLKGENSRKCSYGDFALIFSALSSVEKTYLKVFEEYSIPVVRGGKSGDYIKLKEIDMLLKLLEVIFDPYKDFELLCVLMSPLFGFTAQEVAQMRLHGKDAPLYSNLLAAKEMQKAAVFFKNIVHWRSVAENRPLKELIADIAESEAANYLVAASDSPEKAIANINLLKCYAQGLSELTGDSSYEFLRLMRNIGDKDKKLASADVSLNGENGAVKLTTIHASKGLEFPICILPGLSKKFNLIDSYGDVIIDVKSGISMRYIEPRAKIRYETLPHFVACQQLRAQAKAEEMRKLYVAMSRARDQLVLVGTDRIEDSRVEPINADSYMQILLKSNSLPVVLASVEANPDIPTKANNALNLTFEFDREFKIDRAYSRYELTLLPKKLTATEINKLKAGVSELVESDEPSIFPRLPSFLKERRLSGKKRGDAYHKVMELIDFKRGEYVAQMSEIAPRFTEQEWKAVNKEQVLNFFESPLGQRALNATSIEKEFALYTEISFEELGLSGLDEKHKERPFVQGVADMFFYEDGDIVLVDYKTNRNWHPEKLKREYNSQLSIYKRAIEEMTGAKVKECWIYSFEVGGVLTDN